MARIRTVKPDLARHRGLYELEQETGIPMRFIWAMFPTVCDKEGRFKWRPWELKLDILPYDDIDFSRVLDALLTRGYVVKYTSQNKEYGCIPTFKTHQVINNREAESILPGPEDNTSKIHEVTVSIETRDTRVDDASSTRLKQDQGEGKGREGKGIGREKVNNTVPQAGPVTESPPCALPENTATPQRLRPPVTVSPADTSPPPATTSPRIASSDVTALFDHWRAVMKHPGAKLTDERRRKITSVLRNYPLASLMKAVDGCAVTPHNMGENDRSERYDDICLIIRDSGHIERFMCNADNPPKPESKARGQPQKLSPMQRAIKACDDAFGPKTTEVTHGNAERHCETGNGQNDGPPARLRAIPGRLADDDTGHG